MAYILPLQTLWDMELEQLYKERETTDPDPEMWRWSPLELWEFVRMLEVAVRVVTVNPTGALRELGIAKIKFCEAGSGIGTKLYVAKQYFELSEVGFEISDDYLAKSARLEVNASKMDLRTESPNWSAYDIIYTARPFKTDEMESAWEQAVQDAMRPGAVLISAYTSTKPYSWQCFYRAPFRGVWQKPFAIAKSPGVYDQMIQRQEPYDPLVPMPVGYPG